MSHNYEDRQVKLSSNSAPRSSVSVHKVQHQLPVGQIFASLLKMQPVDVIMCEMKTIFTL